MSFELHPQLAADTHRVSETDDCLLLVMNDRQYPWFIVVPKVEATTEWHHLDPDQQTRVHGFCVSVGQAIQSVFGSRKINTAALGNIVSQLHIHVIGRTPDDPAWPGPVWGAQPPLPLSDADVETRTLMMKQYLGADNH
ncbi:MAG: hypothetical protein CML06_16070 [Pseudomonadales bacterium]|nr:hypothetical protein [Pseudomonadales bacterium]